MMRFPMIFTAAALVTGMAHAETQIFEVEACTEDNKRVANTFSVTSFFDRDIPSDMQDRLDTAWQQTVLDVTLEQVMAVGPIWGRYHNALSRASGEEGLRILATNGGSTPKDGFCFQPIGQPA